MKDLKHTPGPWYSTCYAGHWEICDSEYYESAQLLNERDYQNAEFNAKLAAAAPELLEALMNLENDNGAIPDHAWEMVQSAIKKATE